MTQEQLRRQVKEALAHKVIDTWIDKYAVELEDVMEKYKYKPTKGMRYHAYDNECGIDLNFPESMLPEELR